MSEATCASKSAIRAACAPVSAVSEEISADCAAISSSAACNDPDRVATRLSSCAARVSSRPSASDSAFSRAFSVFSSSSWFVISSDRTNCTIMKIDRTKIITIRSEVIASTKPGQIEPEKRFPARR